MVVSRGGGGGDLDKATLPACIEHRNIPQGSDKRTSIYTRLAIRQFGVETQRGGGSTLGGREWQQQRQRYPPLHPSMSAALTSAKGQSLKPKRLIFHSFSASSFLSWRENPSFSVSERMSRDRSRINRVFVQLLFPIHVKGTAQREERVRVNQRHVRLHS